jgi:hypothetical protein
LDKMNVSVIHLDLRSDILTDTMLAALPSQFAVWLASSEAKFLKSKYVWVNWDVDELMARAEEIKASRLLTVMLDGVPM